MSKEEKPMFVTEHGGRLFKVLGGYTIELPDGSKVIMNPEAVVDAPITEKKDEYDDEG